jgi:hypothetical protein
MEAPPLGTRAGAHLKPAVKANQRNLSMIQMWTMIQWYLKAKCMMMMLGEPTMKQLDMPYK